MIFLRYRYIIELNYDPNGITKVGHIAHVSIMERDTTDSRKAIFAIVHNAIYTMFGFQAGWYSTNFGTYQTSPHVRHYDL